jgi:hypothetical protein
MQRHTHELDRWTGFNYWTLMSCTTIAILICSSVGCVSWKHNLRKHSWCAKAAQKHDGRYYHCPHCGQIIPQAGNQCPGCFKVPAHYGYAATCWRTFPEGWGCLPETVAKNPTFFQTGMLETEQPVQAAHTSDFDNKDKDGGDDNASGDDAADMDVEEIAPPIPDAEPSNSEVQNSHLPDDSNLAEVEESVVMPNPTASVPSHVVEPTVPQEAKTPASKPSPVKNPSVTSTPTVSRIPVLSSKVALETEPRTDELGDRTSEAPTTVQLEQPIKPQDEYGPIPVRRVRLTGLENPATTPGDLRTVSDRTITNVKKNLVQPAPLNTLHPAPARRISLSELPVSIE